MDATAPAGSSDTPPAYVGLWPRLGANLVDILVLVPVILFDIWARAHYRMFRVWVIPWRLLVFAFYRVFLIGRFGGTPGKMILGIEIRKVDGSPVRYGQAFLRGFPDTLFYLMLASVSAFAALNLSDAEYLSMSVRARTAYFRSFSPGVYQFLEFVGYAWILADIIVFFCNDERRALHDFVAGTIVLKAPVNW